MKKLASFIFLAAIFILGIFTVYNRANSKKIKIVTALTPQYNFVSVIAFKIADIDNLINADTNPAVPFTPSSEDIEKIQNCDIFIYAGLESDNWIEGIIPALVYLSNIKVIALVNLSEGLEEDDENYEETEEEIWNSPKKIKNIAANLCEILQETDPKNAKKYKRNADNFIKKLDDIQNALLPQYNEKAAAFIKK